MSLSNPVTVILDEFTKYFSTKKGKAELTTLEELQNSVRILRLFSSPNKRS